MLASRLQTHGGAEAAKLSPEEEATARSIFERSRTSQGGSEKGLKVVKFKGLMIDMSISAGKPIPSEKDMIAAFEAADMDNSGFVDEEEFLELYAHCKDGNMNGLAKKKGSFFFGQTKKLSFSTTKANEAAAAAAAANGTAAPEMGLADVEKAKAIFEKAMKGAKEDGLGPFKFKGAMINLSMETGQDIPSEADMMAAFQTADADNSGLVDAGEFIELYAHCKGGNMKGLAKGSFFGKKQELFISPSSKLKYRRSSLSCNDLQKMRTDEERRGQADCLDHKAAAKEADAKSEVVRHAGCVQMHGGTNKAVSDQVLVAVAGPSLLQLLQGSYEDQLEDHNQNNQTGWSGTCELDPICELRRVVQNLELEKTSAEARASKKAGEELEVGVAKLRDQNDDYKNQIKTLHDANQLLQSKAERAEAMLKAQLASKIELHLKPEAGGARKGQDHGRGAHHIQAASGAAPRDVMARFRFMALSE